MTTEEQKQLIQTTSFLERNTWKVPDSNEKISSQEAFQKAIEYSKRAKDFGVGFQFSIGTDSQIIKNGYRFVTVLCVYIEGKGGMYYYLTEFLEKDVCHYNGVNKKMRMFDEVSRSIETANLLFETFGIASEIHIDASPEKNNQFTSGIVEQLRGYAMSCGFDVKIKPESFCACFIADKHSKTRDTKRRRKHNRTFHTKKK